MIYIVGAGLFGSVARDALRRMGLPCQTIDDGRPLSGSPPAGCLTKPSWLTGLGNRRDNALELLDVLYGIQVVPLRLGPLRLESIMHIPPKAILRESDIHGEVIRVDPDNGVITLRSGQQFVGTVLVAAGVWCGALLPRHFADVKLLGLQGMSARFTGSLPEARMKLWAPFKQSVAFEITPEVCWFGDGMSVKPESWGQEHSIRFMEHAAALGLAPELLIEQRVGIRPYVPGHVGWFQKVGRKCWVTTGGAKNGVVLAAAQAQQFVDAIAN